MARSCLPPPPAVHRQHEAPRLALERRGYEGGLFFEPRELGDADVRAPIRDQADLLDGSHAVRRGRVSPGGVRGRDLARPPVDEPPPRQALSADPRARARTLR